MADIGTMTTDERARSDASQPPSGRRIRRARGLPGSRAVVGALLVTAAAVGVFAAFLSATATPDTSYVIARQDVPIGTVLTEEMIRDRFGLIAIDLPAEVAANAIGSDHALSLAGQRTTAALAPNDLLMRTALSASGASEDDVTLSFAIEPSRAVDGNLEPGDRIDVAVTYGQGPDAYTLYVARNVLMVDSSTPTGGFEGESVVLTLSLPDDERALAIVQAVNTGDVVVTRAAASAGERGTSVPAYTPPATADGAPPVSSLEPRDDDAEG
ncbi:MAG: hypothetical protein WEB09_03140 [Nitriliruptor sp.]